jgi:hypothetical protein
MTWRRIRQGTGHRYVDDAGEAVPGVTTILRAGMPKGGLAEGAAKETARWTVDHWSELTDMEMIRRYERIVKEGRSAWWAAGVRGTKVHEYAQQLAAGEDVDVPTEYVAHVDSYLAFVDEWQVTELAVEVPVFNYTHRYAGTADLLAVLGANTTAPVLIDWKTSASGIWPEVALQLAAYAHAEAMLLPDQPAPVPLPDIVAAYAVWLRADGYDVHQVSISEDTWLAFLYVQQVAAFVEQPREATIGEALRSPFVVAS